jgi:hypothetical protein
MSKYGDTAALLPKLVIFVSHFPSRIATGPPAIAVKAMSQSGRASHGSKTPEVSTRTNGRVFFLTHSLENLDFWGKFILFHMKMYSNIVVK